MILPPPSLSTQDFPHTAHHSPLTPPTHQIPTSTHLHTSATLLHHAHLHTHLPALSYHCLHCTFYTPLSLCTPLSLTTQISPLWVLLFFSPFSRSSRVWEVHYLHHHTTSHVSHTFCAHLSHAHTPPPSDFTSLSPLLFYSCLLPALPTPTSFWILPFVGCVSPLHLPILVQVHTHLHHLLTHTHHAFVHTRWVTRSGIFLLLPTTLPAHCVPSSLLRLVTSCLHTVPVCTHTCLLQDFTHCCTFHTSLTYFLTCTPARSTYCTTLYLPLYYTDGVSGSHVACTPAHLLTPASALCTSISSFPLCSAARFS